MFYNLMFQEGMPPIMELLIYFNDYMMFLLIFIITFVTMMMIFIYKGMYINFKMINNNMIEMIWTVVPMFMLLFMAFPSLFILYMMDDMSNSNMLIKIVGHQWYWEYEYNSINKMAYNSYLNNSFFYCLNTDNSMPLPNMMNIQLLITSIDVIHSWTIPSMGIKVDAIPGRLNSIQFIPMVNGIYYGQCSEICGVNHSFMPITMNIMPMKAFNNLI